MNPLPRQHARLRWATALLLAGCALPRMAHAQDAAASAAAEDAGTENDIVVTAQKRTENVQDIPKSVQVASQADLTNAGVTQLRELSNISPSVTGADQSQNSRAPGIRGVVSIANSIGVQSQTGVILDDIPLPTFSTLANELSDVRRVEVFAGPQSTLSGRNAAGGIINIVTRDPEFTPKADFGLEQTDDRQTRFTAFATTPLTDTIALSASTFLNHWSGNLRNSEIDGRFGGFKTEGVRAKLLWQPSDKFHALLTGYYLASDRTQAPFLVGGPYVSTSSGAATLTLDPSKRPLSSLPYTIDGDNRTVSSEQTGTSQTRDKGATLRLDLDVGKLGTVSSLTSYSRSAQPREDVFFGFPGGGLNADYIAYTDVRTKYITQEVRLASDDRGPVTYLLGAIYTDTDIAQPYKRALFGNLNWDRTVRSKSYAAFGRATWNVTDSDALTGGLRYQYDDQAYTWTFRSLATNAQTDFSSGDSNYDFFAGEVSYKHEFSRDLSAYVTLSRSQTGEAYDVEDNVSAAAGELQPLASEKVKNVEAGFKSQFFDRRLTVNLNAFLADYSDYQIQTIDSSDVNAAPVIRLLALGKVRTKGAEFSSSLRATDNLNLSFSMAYTDTKIRDYPNAACNVFQMQERTCVNGTQGNLRGLALPDAPKYKLNASADYTLPLPSAPFDATFGAFYRYQSKVHYDLLGDPLSYQKGYGVLNLRVGLADHDKRWTLEAFVNNVLDKNYYSSIRDVRNRFDALATGFTPLVQAARYDRGSFRYAGLRTTVKF